MLLSKGRDNIVTLLAIGVIVFIAFIMFNMQKVNFASAPSGEPVVSTSTSSTNDDFPAIIDTSSSVVSQTDYMKFGDLNIKVKFSDEYEINFNDGQKEQGTVASASLVGFFEEEVIKMTAYTRDSILFASSDCDVSIWDCEEINVPTTKVYDGLLDAYDFGDDYNEVQKVEHNGREYFVNKVDCQNNECDQVEHVTFIDKVMIIFTSNYSTFFDENKMIEFLNSVDFIDAFGF